MGDVPNLFSCRHVRADRGTGNDSAIAACVRPASGVKVPKLQLRCSLAYGSRFQGDMLSYIAGFN